MRTDGYETYHFIMYANIKSLCSIPETNIILEVDYISSKQKKKHLGKTQELYYRDP